MPEEVQYELGERIFARHSAMFARPLRGFVSPVRLPLLDAVRRRTGIGPLLPDIWSAPVFTSWPFRQVGTRMTAPGVPPGQLSRKDSGLARVASVEPVAAANENPHPAAGTSPPIIQRQAGGDSAAGRVTHQRS